ncbi:hypothetical protein [Pollutibacter soli]|uniref:hypothetical protein n=1 Tax=Pollutibacter soli TaxID=3034157 RepID=UPI003013C5E9
MKKTICSFVLSTLLVVIFQAVHSQDTSKTPAERAARLTEWMNTNLSLTDAQLPEVQKINLKYANKNEEIKNSSGSKMQKGKAVKANDKAKDSELSSVLNPDQYKTYQDKKAELREKFKEEAKKKRNQ